MRFGIYGGKETLKLRVRETLRNIIFFILISFVKIEFEKKNLSLFLRKVEVGL